jgi:segregation and condensation protein A
MADYRVKLEIFAGPLDLLLYLVRKNEVDIYDIPLAQITDQYMRYIEMLKNLDFDLAGDFLVMAATLMQIKSAMLLPAADTGQDQAEDLSDPKAELIRQLLEYKKFKDAANLLSAAAETQQQRAGRPPTSLNGLKGETEPEIDMDQLSAWDLLDAFDSILKATGGAAFDMSLIKDETPIDLYQIEILHRLQAEGPMRFAQIFESKGRTEMIGLFLGLLELIRAKLVWAEQADSDEAIELRALTDRPAEEAVAESIAAAESPAPQRGEPPVEIAETAPGGSKTAAPAPEGPAEGAVPIVETPAKGPAVRRKTGQPAAGLRPA